MPKPKRKVYHVTLNPGGGWGKKKGTWGPLVFQFRNHDFCAVWWSCRENLG